MCQVYIYFPPRAQLLIFPITSPNSDFSKVQHRIRFSTARYFHRANKKWSSHKNVLDLIMYVTYHS